MLVDVYKRSSNPNRFLSVPVGTDVSKFSVAELHADYRAVAVFKRGVDVDPSTPGIALSSAEIVRDIADHGFATHGALVTATLGKS